MLTREEAIVEYDDTTRLAHPDRLTRQRHAHYLPPIERILQIYAGGLGETRKTLHQRTERELEELPDASPKRIRAFCKLLDEVSEYHTDRQKSAVKLRQRVFSLAAKYHPLVERAEGIFCNLEGDVKQQIAKELKRTWEAIDADLFADVIEFQRLKLFAGYPTPTALLSRYNVAQTQAALYRAEFLTIWSETDHKMILRFAKLARLMHSIRREPSGSYCFRFDGPVSVLRGSTRYGVAMARFLPGLLSCKNWRGTARLVNRFQQRYRLELSSTDGLSSAVSEIAEFDSDLEQTFAIAWEKSNTRGWRLERETDLLHYGQTVLTPDFTLVGPMGERVLLEIIGYWTPEYLKSKAESLIKFVNARMLLAIPEQTKMTVPSGFAPPIVFKKTLKPEDVVSRLCESH